MVTVVSHDSRKRRRGANRADMEDIVRVEGSKAGAQRGGRTGGAGGLPAEKVPVVVPGRGVEASEQCFEALPSSGSPKHLAVVLRP